MEDVVQAEKEMALMEIKEVQMESKAAAQKVVVKTCSTTLGLTCLKATNQEKKNQRQIGNPGMIKMGLLRHQIKFLK